MIMSVNVLLSRVCCATSLARLCCFQPSLLAVVCWCRFLIVRGSSASGPNVTQRLRIVALVRAAAPSCPVPRRIPPHPPPIMRGEGDPMRRGIRVRKQQHTTPHHCSSEHAPGSGDRDGSINSRAPIRSQRPSSSGVDRRRGALTFLVRLDSHASHHISNPSFADAGHGEVH